MEEDRRKMELLLLPSVRIIKVKRPVIRHAVNGDYARQDDL